MIAMKYSLRSLMIVVLVMPPLLASIYFACQPSPPSGPELVPVEGIVRLNGKPVAADVDVILLFDDNNVANGQTDNGGEFFLGFLGHIGCPLKPAKVLIYATDSVPIPARYADVRQTPLTATPRKGKTNYIVLDLSTP